MELILLLSLNKAEPYAKSIWPTFIFCLKILFFNFVGTSKMSGSEVTNEVFETLRNTNILQPRSRRKKIILDYFSDTQQEDY